MSDTTIVVSNPFDCEIDPVMWTAVMNHVRRNLPTEAVCVMPANREKTGWLEWGIRYKSIYVGAIQRQVGAEVEFHS